MTQKAKPISDDVNRGWTPTKVTPQVNEPAADDSTYVSSSANPQGDTFQVKLAELAWPEAGAETLTVRLQQMGGGSDSVTVALLQGDGTIIALRVVQPSSSFDNAFDPPLSETEIKAITDYTDLHVRVIAGNPVVPCCPEGVPAVLHATFSNGTGSCACLNGVSVQLLYQGTDPFGNYVWNNGAQTPELCGWPTTLILICNHSDASWNQEFQGCLPVPLQPDTISCNPFLLRWTNVAMLNCCTDTVTLSVTG